MFKSVGQMIDAELQGKTRTYTWRKTSSAAFQSGWWFDLASATGNPVSKYWFDAPPLIAKAVYQSTDGGLFHGADVSPSTKYLKSITVRNVGAGTVPSNLQILDYLLYYPTIEDGVLGPQIFDNTVTLPRYTEGEGVMAIAVSIAARTGGAGFTINYTNSQGVSGRTSKICYQVAASGNNTLLGSMVTGGSLTQSAQPWISLQDGDTGIRSIESVTMLGADTGLFSLILVKPIAQVVINNILSCVEKDFFLHGGVLPKIEEDAFLGIIGNSSNSSVPSYFGDLKVIWE